MFRYTLLSLKDFLRKIKFKPNMSINEALIEYNKKKFPNPTFLNRNKILAFYGNKLDERKIKTWAEEGLIRLEYHPTLATTKNTIFDPNNPKHVEIGKGEDIEYYAKEDFEAFIDNDLVRKNTKMEIAQVHTNFGKKILLRDYRKKNPTPQEMDNLSDSYGTFIAYAAQKKIEEEAGKSLDEQTAKTLKEFLNKIIPQKL